MIPHEIFRAVSRFPSSYISCYIAENRLSLALWERKRKKLGTKNLVTLSFYGQDVLTLKNG